MTVWKWSGESRYPGALPSVLENLRRAFSSGPTDPHPSPGIRGCNQGNKKLLCSLCTFCALTMHSAPWPSRPHIMHISWNNKSIPTIGLFIREKISRGLHKARTPRINGTKSMFTAYSTQGQLKPRLILAEGFWDGLLQAKYGHHFLFLSGFFFLRRKF